MALPKVYGGWREVVKKGVVRLRVCGGDYVSVDSVCEALGISEDALCKPLAKLQSKPPDYPRDTESGGKPCGT